MSVKHKQKLYYLSIRKNSKKQKGGNMSERKRDRLTPDQKRRIVELADGGLKPLEAFERAYEEFGLELKASYRKQPGSHLHRIRKQVEAAASRTEEPVEEPIEVQVQDGVIEFPEGSVNVSPIEPEADIDVE